MPAIHTVRAVIFFVVLFLWMGLLVALSQVYPQLLVFICFVIPAIAFYFFPVTGVRPRLKQLIGICSYFMLLVCAFYWLTVFFSSALVSFSNYFFISYFLIQSSGFLIDIVKNKRQQQRLDLGIPITLLGLLNIIVWIFAVTNSHFMIQDEQRILIFGVQEPWYIICVYCLWFAYVIMNSSTLPNLAELIAHSFSLIIAAFSGQFFLSRLLLASQLFILDYFFGYTQKEFFIKAMPRLSMQIYPDKWREYQYYLSIVCALLLTLILCWQFYLIGSV